MNDRFFAPRPARLFRAFALILSFGFAIAPPIAHGLDPAGSQASNLRTPETAASGRIVRSGYEKVAAEAHGIVESIRTENGIPGMSAAVWMGDGIVWSEGFGLVDLEHEVPVTRETRFRLGSCSKVLTATLTARMVQEGTVELDRDIRDYLPSFPQKEAVITLRLLLGHLSGIRHYTRKDFDFSAPGGIIDLRPYPTTESALALFQDDPLIARPGDKYSYSTFGYTLISAVLEAAAKKSFLELMREELLSPLGLERTGGDDWQLVIPHRTSYYEKSKDGKIVHATPVSQAYKWAGGGIISTAEDLVRFGAAHFSPGFLAADTLESMFTPQKTNAGTETTVGLGWRIDKGASEPRAVHHAGSMGGCRAVLIVYPEQKLAVAMLSNLSESPGPIKEHAEKIAGYFLDFATNGE